MKSTCKDIKQYLLEKIVLMCIFLVMQQNNSFSDNHIVFHPDILVGVILM